MIVALHILTIPLAFFYCNFLEWASHKYVLHGLGKNKKSFWAFHWHEHHKLVRKYEGFDPSYKTSFKGAVLKEKLVLFALLLMHWPLFSMAPLFYLTSVYCTWNYYNVHKKSHEDVEWAKKNVPWHYEHHMGKDQEKNWCITKDWCDKLFGTRVKYLKGNRK